MSESKRKAKRFFPPIKGRTVEQRFWEKVDTAPGQGPKGDCWEWLAGGEKYGHFSIDHKVQMGAHVFSYRLHHGDIPDGMEVCHKCDNPPCVNPFHLYAGTHKQNMALAAARGRGVGRKRIYPKKEKGEKARRIFVTPEQAEAIKEARISRGVAQADLAFMAGVHFTHYSRFEKAARGLRLEQVTFIVQYLGIQGFDFDTARIVDLGYEVKEPHKRPRTDEPLPVESLAAQVRLGLLSERPTRKVYMTKKRRAQAAA
jgi:transcriptional regulator with XRE-family HTH domain